jgi:hypothetical protein
VILFGGGEIALNCVSNVGERLFLRQDCFVPRTKGFLNHTATYCSVLLKHASAKKLSVKRLGNFLKFGNDGSFVHGSYSYLNASIGSNRAAFHAGHNPKISPIPTLDTNPAIGAQIGT